MCLTLVPFPSDAAACQLVKAQRSPSSPVEPLSKDIPLDRNAHTQQLLTSLLHLTVNEDHAEML